MLLLIAGLLAAPALLPAQIVVDVVQDSVPMSKGRYHAYSLTLNNASVEDAESILREAFKSYKAKVSGNYKTEVFFDDAKIKALSDNTVDVYVRVYQASTDVKVDAFFDLGGIFLNPKTHPEQSKLAEQMMRDYAIRYKRFQVQQELAEQEKLLGEREKELESLIKDKEGIEKTIASAERDIEKTRQEIASNDMDQQRKRAEIETQKDVIVKISDAVGDEKKVAEKTLKTLEKDLEKLEKDEEKMHQSIQDQQSKIEENRRNIERNLADQEAKKQNIAAQKSKVSEVQSRLSGYPTFK